MGRLTRRSIFFALLWTCAAPALAADPILMFLLSAAREVIVAAAARGLAAEVAEPQPSVSASASAYPGTVVEPEHLKRLIDEGFGYLSGAQRQEVFDSLHAALLDPRNAATRGPTIEYFAQKALAVREAQARLSGLTQREKEILAAEFRKSVAALPKEEVAKLAELLRQRLLPVPSDLNELLLAALEG